MADPTPNANRGLVEALEWAIAELDGSTRYDEPGQYSRCLIRARQALASISSPEEGAERRAVNRLLSHSTAALEDDLATTADYLAELRNRNIRRVVTVWKDGSWREQGLPDAEISATEPDHLVDIPIAVPAPATQAEREAVMAAINSGLSTWIRSGEANTSREHIADAILSLLESRHAG